ncbi:hypothetical protein [Aquimarina sp. RZ0]|uniref:hypothetical protein n=1 Tax=Aquimarina sp. RZ0 TaxID=2607730 RepID=UPI0011F20D3A|nr:hypothetical protein [Aquimarina sp. RZ0]KAA1246187.1 hypothetical protein F0000_08600 [Aquimarina sp. RZ0]
MRNLLLLFILFFGSCSSDKKLKKPTTEKLKEKTVEISESTINNQKDPEKELDKLYERVFIAKSEGGTDDFFQKLSFLKTSKNEIDYHLIYSNQLCDGECTGKAILKNDKALSEIHKYPEGDYTFSYFQFEDQKNTFTIIIKLQASDQNEAQVEFSFNQNNEDCDPYNTTMLAIK